jgi:hypothetical protein
MAWAMLAGPAHHDVQPGRERESPSTPRGDEPALSKEGYAEEALPWLDAVYRFALRLTQGDRDAAEDLVQETSSGLTGSGTPSGVRLDGQGSSSRAMTWSTTENARPAYKPSTR